jgi:hypothetical protein
VMERIYRQPYAANPNAHYLQDITSLRTGFEAVATKLYSKILEYVAQGVCQFSRSQVAKFNDWKLLVSEIKELELRCKNFTDVIDSASLQLGFDEQRRTARFMADIHVRGEILNQFRTEASSSDRGATEAQDARLIKVSRDRECVITPLQSQILRNTATFKDWLRGTVRIPSPIPKSESAADKMDLGY